MKHLYIFSFLVVTCAVLAGLLISQPAAAYSQNGSSTRQEVAFLFYKMIGEKPDFDLWTKENLKHINTYGQLGTRDYVTSVRKKAVDKFNSTNVNEDILIIDYPATMEVLPVDKKDKSKYYVNVYFEKSPPFIAYQIPDYKINIVVPGIEDKIKFYITAEEHQRLDKVIYGGLREKHSSHVRMYLKPVKVDTENTMQRKDGEYTLMLTKLIDFEIRNDSSRKKHWPLPPSKEEIEAKKTKAMKENFMDKYK